MKLHKQLKELNSQLGDAIDKTKFMKKSVKATKVIDHEEVLFVMEKQ